VKNPIRKDGTVTGFPLSLAGKRNRRKGAPSVEPAHGTLLFSKNMKLIKNIKALMSKEILPSGAMVKLLRDHNVILLLFQKYGYRMVHAIFPSEVNHSSRLQTMYSFAGYLHQMYLHHGAVFVVQYLKVGQLAIQKAIARTPLSSMKEVSVFPFPRLTEDGLPVFINSVDRGLIRSGHSSVIRFWLTLFSVYRVITLPGVLKLNTITDTPGYDKDKMQSIADLISMKWDPSMLNISILKQEPELLLLESASAGSKVSLLDYSATAFKLSQTPLFETFTAYAQLLGYDQIMTNIKLVLQDDRLQLLWNNRIDTGHKAGIPFGQLGKLSAKDEPAGKVRIFAMIDPWTQSILKPLHNVIFNLLERLPNDAMRDQQAAVQRAMSKATASNQSFGYDLSAATDRLPLDFQISILNTVLPSLGTL
jgi:hypothetical protein